MVSLLKTALTNTRRSGHGPRRPKMRSNLETLEARNLLSANSWPGLLNPQADAEPNNTLDAAQELGQVARGQNVEFVGSIGDGADRNTDVDWFRFTLASSGRVQITSLPNAEEVATPVVLTLYGDQLAEFDPALPLQHRLLGRTESDSNTSGAQVDVRLQAGTYFVAVSGSGNRHFHPFVTDSGLPGSTTAYGVRIELASGQAPAGNPDQFAAGPESGRDGDDTPTTATKLGDLAAIGRLQVSGAIGNDPFYKVASKNPLARNPASDVDLYQFKIDGEGSFALVAETFAGRIGSSLDPALALYRADEFGSLKFVGANNNTLNDAQSSNGQFPFFTDAVLFSRLTAGEYYLAVSSSGNDAESGPDGVFNPHVAHSGINGESVGAYVLDLLVYPDGDAPQVIATTPAGGSINSQSPRHIEVQFSEFVNLQQLAYSAFQQVGASTVSAVFIVGSDGARYFPRLESYDASTGTARFLMLDGLPNGEAKLHLSGALGLADLAGNPLAGNDPSGDFVTRFFVADASRNDARLQNASGNDSFETRQDLGVLFPHELQSGVTFTRDASTNAGQPADTEDFVQFELLQSQSYFITRTNTGSGDAPAIKLFDQNGQAISLGLLPRGSGLRGFLQAGTYVLRVGPWEAATSSDVTYRVAIRLGGVSENPTPLTSGAAPAVGIRLLSNGSVIPQASQSPIVFSPPVIGPNIASANSAAIPSSLLRGLEMAPLGGNGGTIQAPSSDTTLVRLFGFSNRDALFAGLDSLLRPNARQVPFSLSGSELLDLTLGAINRSAVEEAPNESIEPESVTPEESLKPSEPANSATDDPSDPAKTVPPATSSEVPVESSDAIEMDKTKNSSVSSRKGEGDESQSAIWPLALITATTMSGSLLKAETSHQRQRQPKGWGIWQLLSGRA